MTPTVKMARLIRFYLPHSRSILNLQKNGTDAERRTDRRADACAVFRADVGADNLQKTAPLQKRLQKPFAEMRDIRGL
jgi:hypothetical protein